MKPMMLESMFREVMPGYDPSHTMVVIQHHQMSQSHGAEKAIASLHGRALIDGVGRGVHVLP